MYTDLNVLLKAGLFADFHVYRHQLFYTIFVDVFLITVKCLYFLCSSCDSETLHLSVNRYYYQSAYLMAWVYSVQCVAVNCKGSSMKNVNLVDKVSVTKVDLAVFDKKKLFTN